MKFCYRNKAYKMEKIVKFGLLKKIFEKPLTQYFKIYSLERPNII